MYKPTRDYRAKDSLLTGDPNKVIYGAHMMEEFEAISDQFYKNDQKGIVASCKYNGQYWQPPNNGLMYAVNVTSVENGWAPQGGHNPNGLLPGQYKVNFKTNIPDFDQHYAPVVTAFPAIVDGKPSFPTTIALQGFYADGVVFTVHQVGGPENGGAPEDPVGFSLLIVDMEGPD